MKKKLALFLSAITLGALSGLSSAFAQDQTVVMTTAKAVGSKMTLYVNYTYDGVTVDWGDGTPVEYNKGRDMLRMIEGTVKGSKITLAGSKYIKTLICQGNELTALDVSNAKYIRSLYCQNNQLTSLNLKPLTEMTDLNCSNNALTSINVTKTVLPNLETLDISNNKLTATTFSQPSDALQYLNLSGCGSYKTLSLTSAGNLDFIDCSGNSVTALRLPSSGSVSTINACDNELTSVDLSKQVQLCQLYADNNAIVSDLDLSAMSTLTDISLANNDISVVSLPSHKLNAIYYPNNRLYFSSMPKVANVPQHFVPLPQKPWNLPDAFQKTDEGAYYVNICPDYDSRNGEQYVVDVTKQIEDFNGQTRTNITVFNLLDDDSSEELKRMVRKGAEGDYTYASGKMAFLRGLGKVFLKLTHANSTYKDYEFISEVFSVGKENTVGISSTTVSRGELQVAVADGEVLLYGGSGNVSIYSADGKRVWNGSAQQPVTVRLPKGVYIIGGRKVAL